MNILLATIPLMIAIIMLAGLPLDWLMAAQNGAGSIATMVSPARTVLAATSAGIVGKEGQIVHKVGLWS